MLQQPSYPLKPFNLFIGIPDHFEIELSGNARFSDQFKQKISLLQLKNENNFPLNDATISYIATAIFFSLVAPCPSYLQDPYSITPEKNVRLEFLLTKSITLFQLQRCLGEGAERRAFQGIEAKKIVENGMTTIRISSVAIIQFDSKINTYKVSYKKTENLAKKFSSEFVLKPSIASFEVPAQYPQPPFLFVVQELLTDLSIENIIAQKFTFKEVFCALEGAFKGLAYLHQLNMLHGDVKPANLFMDRNGIGKIGDLEYTVECTSLNDIAYSPFYAPPELSLDDDPDVLDKKNLNPSDNKAFWKTYSQTQAGDIWAAGLTCYEIANLKLPTYYYLIDSLPQLHRMHYNLKFKGGWQPYIDSLFASWNVPGIAGTAMQTLITKLLSVNPAQRGTAVDLHTEIKKIHEI